MAETEEERQHRDAALRKFLAEKEREREAQSASEEKPPTL